MAFARYPPARLRYQGEEPVALLGVRIPPSYRLVDLPLGSPASAPTMAAHRPTGIGRCEMCSSWPRWPLSSREAPCTRRLRARCQGTPASRRCFAPRPGICAGSDRSKLKGSEAGVIHRVLGAAGGDVRMHRVRAGDRHGPTWPQPPTPGGCSACYSGPSRCCWRWSRSGTSAPDADGGQRRPRRRPRQRPGRHRRVTRERDRHHRRPGAAGRPGGWGGSPWRR